MLFLFFFKEQLRLSSQTFCLHIHYFFQVTVVFYIDLPPSVFKTDHIVACSLSLPALYTVLPLLDVDEWPLVQHLSDKPENVNTHASKD